MDWLTQLYFLLAFISLLAAIHYILKEYYDYQKFVEFIKIKKYVPKLDEPDFFPFEDFSSQKPQVIIPEQVMNQDIINIDYFGSAYHKQLIKDGRLPNSIDENGNYMPLSKVKAWEDVNTSNIKDLPKLRNCHD